MDIARVAHALSDPIRMKILDLLATGRGQACCSPVNPDVPDGICACDLLAMIEGMGQSRLSYHMKILRDAALVRDRKQGKWVYYTLNHEGVAEFVSALSSRYGGSPPQSASLGQAS